MGAQWAGTGVYDSCKALIPWTEYKNFLLKRVTRSCLDNMKKGAQHDNIRFQDQLSLSNWGWNPTFTGLVEQYQTGCILFAIPTLYM